MEQRVPTLESRNSPRLRRLGGSPCRLPGWDEQQVQRELQACAEGRGPSPSATSICSLRGRDRREVAPGTKGDKRYQRNQVGRDE